MLSVLIPFIVLSDTTYELGGEGGVVDVLMQDKIEDSIWTVQCDGTFELCYLNDFGGTFYVTHAGNSLVNQKGEYGFRTTEHFTTNGTVTLTAHIKWTSGNKKVLFSWSCNGPAAPLPASLNKAGEVSYRSEYPDEGVLWTITCQYRPLLLTWLYFNGDGVLHFKRYPDGGETMVMDIEAEENRLVSLTLPASSSYTYVSLKYSFSRGGFAFRYFCGDTTEAPPTSGPPTAIPTEVPPTPPKTHIEDTLLPNTPGDRLWHVSCYGVFALHYVNDFGGDFIVSNGGPTHLAQSPGDDTVPVEMSFASWGEVTLLAHATYWSGNKKVLFTWGCNTAAPPLPPAGNTAGNVTHLLYSGGENVVWDILCEENTHIMWSSFDTNTYDVVTITGEDAGHIVTLLRTSGTVLPNTTTYKGHISVHFVSTTPGTGFSFRYECRSTDVTTHTSSGLIEETLLGQNRSWQVACKGELEVVYLNSFEGNFTVSIDGGPSYVNTNGNKTELSTVHHSIKEVATFAVSLSNDGSSTHGAVFVSWGCNTAASPLQHEPSENVTLEIRCDSHAQITWQAFTETDTPEYTALLRLYESGVHDTLHLQVGDSVYSGGDLLQVLPGRSGYAHALVCVEIEVEEEGLLGEETGGSEKSTFPVSGLVAVVSACLCAAAAGVFAFTGGKGDGKTEGGEKEMSAQHDMVQQVDAHPLLL